MSDGLFTTLISKDREANAITNPIYTQLSDGTVVFPSGGGVEATALRVTIASDSTGLLSIDDGGGSITVDGTVGISGTVTVSATDLDIRDLAHTQDSVQIGDGASVTLDIVEADAAAGGTDSGLAAMAIRDDVLTTLTPADGDYSQLRVDSTGKLWVNAVLTNTEITPLYVYVVNTVVSGSEVHDYDTQAALASDTADDHDYAVAGTVAMLKQVLVSSSGACKIEVSTGPTAGTTTIAVGFIPKHGGSWEWTLAIPREVLPASTGVIRVTRTNREGSAQDVYSTIVCSDVA